MNGDDKTVAMPKVLDDGYETKKDCGWRQQEKRVAKRVGGRVQPGSGSKDFAKGDVKQDMFLIECKFTSLKSMRLELKWLRKISREAMAVGKIPALNIEIRHDDVLTPNDWTLVPTETLRRLLGES